ncbi:MAG: hypothetical protein II197_07155, partial [Peptococcaceae bacterium]|nr:hypothetical protein [Peptococcaceae bacterium]
MKYFSKNKKWMAYLILLTFLFTSIMPTNLATGDSMAYAAEDVLTVELNPDPNTNEADGVIVSKTAV